MTEENKLVELEQRLVELENLIKDLLGIDPDAQLTEEDISNFTIPRTPSFPNELWQPAIISVQDGCATCGMLFSGVMGYVCSNSACPNNFRS